MQQVVETVLRISTRLRNARKASHRRAMLRQADALRDRTLYAEAAVAYELALKADPSNAAVHIQCGHMCKESGDLALAWAHYRVAQFILPDDPDLHLQLGHLLKRAGRTADALTAYRRAASLSPDWVLPLQEAAGLEGLQNGADPLPVQAMAPHLRRLLLRLEPQAQSEAEQTTHIAGLADAARDRKAYAEAVDLYEAALSGQQGYPHLHVQCGHMNKEIGRLAQAEAHYLIAQAEMPDDPDLNLQLGHFYKVAGRLANALHAFERAASLVDGWQEPERELAGIRDRQARLRSHASETEDTSLASALVGSALSLPASKAVDAARMLPRVRGAFGPAPTRGHALAELFDGDYYGRHYGKALPADCDRLQHYLEEGWRSGLNPNALFDTSFYLSNYPDAAATQMNPLLHYILFGQYEGKNPGPVFDTDYYMAVNTDVADQAFNPLYHFLAGGAAEGRDPHPLFSVKYYTTKYGSIIPGGMNPVEHYLDTGAELGFRPNPLFFSDWYAQRSHAAGNPLVHYIQSGYRQAVGPNPLFDPAFYRAMSSGLVSQDIDPLAHYMTVGWRERRDPHPLFSTATYLAQTPSLEQHGINPLAHYLEQGAAADLAPSPWFDPHYYRSVCAAAQRPSVNPLIHYVEMGASQGYEPTRDYWLTSLLDPRDESVARLSPPSPETSAEIRSLSEVLEPQGRLAAFAPSKGVVPLCAPLNVHAVPSEKSPPRLNVLLPVAGMASTSGGPNTVLNLAYRLAAKGVPVRIVSTDGPPDADPAPYLEHSRKLAGVPASLPVDIIVADGSDRSRVLYLGQEDQFLASAWWTAQMIKDAIRQTRIKRFYYMIQDYEPLLHQSSAWSCLAEETYSFDMVPIINTHLLFDYMRQAGIGRFTDTAFCRTALVFEPAVDRASFYPAKSPLYRKRQLLFYARPTTGWRNLYEIGVAVLRRLVSDGTLTHAEWDFIGMGEAFEPVDLGSGATLMPAPWLGFDDYATLMRESSILLSLMLSPHPSYPPIEMAACGGLAVTTEFGNKTAEALRLISPNIIAAAPTPDALAAALAMAVSRLESGETLGHAVSYPGDWDESLAPVAASMFQTLLIGLGAPAVASADGGEMAAVGMQAWPRDPTALMAFEHQRARSSHDHDADPRLLSFVTTVWNTDPKFFGPLIECVLTQQHQGFEWVVLDNGTTRSDTLAMLAGLEKHSFVTLFRVEQNVGIIRGMRAAMERARNRYIVPLDSDDILTPDCVGLTTSFLRRSGYPLLAYTDEDRILGESYLEPYCKPEWDPVLFFHSCYIAHLCLIDRKSALELDIYSDTKTNGSHDWDTFTRFYIAGITPVHIPEIVYSWRLHPQSTAANMGSKSYITSSHQTVLGRLITSRPDPASYSLVPSPLFEGMVDWRFTRSDCGVTPLRLVFGSVPAARQGGTIALALPVDWNALARIADEAATAGQLIHLQDANVVLTRPEWKDEADTLMGLFPDVALVGGYVHHNGRIVAGDVYFQVADGSQSPNLHRLLADPGYFAQAWKPHSCDAVPPQHCVVRPELLAATCRRLAGTCASFEGLGLWLGRLAAERSERIVCTPFFSAEQRAPKQLAATTDERRAQILIQSANAQGRVWPQALGRMPQTAYRRTTKKQVARERAAFNMLAASAALSTEAAMLARRLTTRSTLQLRTLSVLTSVWQKTDADLFAATVRSVMGQTVPPTEWVILRNGPVPGSVQRILDDLSADPRIIVPTVGQNVGIMGAMRVCLEKASCEVVLPMDADDLLAPDAFEVVLQSFAEPDIDFVYTDEDVIEDDATVALIRRSAFDPILNTDDSTIWHLCSFMREKAIALGVYSDTRAEYCHDWDTVSRFAMAGCRIRHIAHVLYHWRVHRQSSSNSGSLNTGSLESVRFIMQRSIDRQTDPARYQIAPFPISRGVEQLAILRRPVSPMPVTVAVLSASASGDVVMAPIMAKHPVPNAIVRSAFGPGGVGRLAAVLDRIGTDLVCILAEGCIPRDGGAWEAMRLFELHADCAFAAGRLHGPDAIITDACAESLDPEQSNPWVGKHVSDPGAAAMALKPHTAKGVPSFYFYARTDALCRAVATMDQQASVTDLGRSVASYAEIRSERIGYSPLIQARIVADPRRLAEPETYARLHPPLMAPSPGPVPARPAAATILSPFNWEEVGPNPTVTVGADFMGRLTVSLLTLANHKAGNRGRTIPLEVAKGSFASAVFTAQPVQPLRHGYYIVSIQNADGVTLMESGFIVGDEPGKRLERLSQTASWRDQTLPAPPPSKANPGAPLFSITSTVYDTPLQFFEELIANILAQGYGDFEWLILDNGSTQPDLVRFIAGLAKRDNRIRVFRVEDNIHIIPGNKYLLSRAKGRYIVPVDSDDVVFADSLERFARYMTRDGFPDLLYSEEVKVSAAGELKEYISRSEPSGLLPLSTCPASHLMCFNRELALKTGVYSDSYAKGSHDWDTYLRLFDAGARSVRVPEALYGWRMHEASSAMSSGAKDYLVSSQLDVLRSSLVRRGLTQFTVQHVPGHSIGYYHLARNRHALPSIQVNVIVLDEACSAASLRRLIKAIDYRRASIAIHLLASNPLRAVLEAEFPAMIVRHAAEAAMAAALLSDHDAYDVIFVIDGLLRPDHPDWLLDATATFELDPAVGIVGGKLRGPDEMLFHAGYELTAGGLLETPNEGSFGDLAVNSIRRGTTATYGSFIAVKSAAAKTLGELRGVDQKSGLYGVDFCRRAEIAGILTGYCPTFSARRDLPLESLSQAGELRSDVVETHVAFERDAAHV